MTLPKEVRNFTLDIKPSNMHFTKSFSTFCAVLLAVTSMAMPKAGIVEMKQDTNCSSDPVIIHIGESVSTEVPGAPRTIVPFIAEYYDLWNAVMLGCSDSIGDVTVTLTSTAGDWYQTVFDTSDGAILIPASGDAGYYTLTIETAAHVIYEGVFYL